MEIVDLTMHGIEQVENIARLGCRHKAAGAPVEEPDTEGIFRIFHEAAEAGRRNVQQPRSACDAAGHHDGAYDLNLS
ncbi:UNVERIFIED_ORG: hypothetical protein GGD47_004655 [Rhizobium etli]